MQGAEAAQGAAAAATVAATGDGTYQPKAAQLHAHTNAVSGRGGHQDNAIEKKVLLQCIYGYSWCRPSAYYSSLCVPKDRAGSTTWPDVDKMIEVNALFATFFFQFPKIQNCQQGLLTKKKKGKGLERFFKK